MVFRLKMKRCLRGTSTIARCVILFLTLRIWPMFTRWSRRFDLLIVLDYESISHEEVHFLGTGARHVWGGNKTTSKIFLNTLIRSQPLYHSAFQVTNKEMTWAICTHRIMAILQRCRKLRLLDVLAHPGVRSKLSKPNRKIINFLQRAVWMFWQY